MKNRATLGYGTLVAGCFVLLFACGRSGGSDGESSFVRSCKDGVCSEKPNCKGAECEDAGSGQSSSGSASESDGGSNAGERPTPGTDGEPGVDGPGSSLGDNGDGSDVSLNNPGAPRFDCSEVRSQQFDSDSMASFSVSSELAATVEATLVAMTPAAKAGQMSGIDGSTRNYRDIMRSSDAVVDGIGTIRGFRFRDAGRGVNLDAGQDNRADDGNNFATAFPAESLRAASFDLDLERRIGAAQGDEAAAANNNALVAPNVNVVRHPYWGRAQESYGEDSYLVGRMATAFTVGAQEYVMACAKHFTGYTLEKGRSSQSATLNEQTLREIYGRPFEMVVQDGGVGCVLAAYNLVNGVKTTQHQHLLRNVLKAPLAEGGMGFDGLVISDWWAMPGDQSLPDAATAQAVTNEAVIAGLDMELPWNLHYNEATLPNADQALVDEAAQRILTQKYRFQSALDSDPWSLAPPTSTLAEGSIAANESHEVLAEEAAVKGMVLLQNGLDDAAPVLPLANATTVAVVGPDQDFSLISSSVPKSCVADETGVVARSCTFHFATDPALGDRGSSRVNADPARSFGPFAGIQIAAGADRSVTSGNSAEAAAAADAVVVVVGYTPGDEGEEYPLASGGDRSSLELPPGHAEFVESVLALDKPTVVVVETGSVVNLPWLSHPNRKQATVWAGYSGMRGGTALGMLLFGQMNFSGKLPMAWPTEADLAPFKDTETVTNLGYFLGYREFDRRQYVEVSEVALLFPFGHGLSYSSFEYANLTLPCETVTPNAVVNVTVDITNTSDVDGDEVAMLFVKPPPKPGSVTGDRPWKELRSFARVRVPAGATVTAELPLRMRDLRRWEGAEDGAWVTDSGDYTILVGKNAADAESGNVAGVLTVSGD